MRLKSRGADGRGGSRLASEDALLAVVFPDKFSLVTISDIQSMPIQGNTGGNIQLPIMRTEIISREQVGKPCLIGRLLILILSNKNSEANLVIPEAVTAG